MRYSNYPFTLDVHKTLSQVSIPVTLGDTARQLFIGLTDGGKPYIIPDGCRATLSARKADGNCLLHDCIIEKNTTIRYDFTEQTATAPGKMDCQILLYGTNGRLITSPRFTMVVYADIVGYDVLSETDLQSIGRMLAAEQERVAAENARVEAEQGRVAADIARDEKLDEALNDLGNRVTIDYTQKGTHDFVNTSVFNWNLAVHTVPMFGEIKVDTDAGFEGYRVNKVGVKANAAGNVRFIVCEVGESTLKQVAVIGEAAVDVETMTAVITFDEDTAPFVQNEHTVILACADGAIIKAVPTVYNGILFKDLFSFADANYYTAEGDVEIEYQRTTDTILGVIGATMHDIDLVDNFTLQEFIKNTRTRLDDIEEDIPDVSALDNGKYVGVQGGKYMLLPFPEVMDGQDGQDGQDGKDGKDGLTPYVGENGNWFIGEVDTGVRAAGQDGKDGVDGQNGVDGVTPHIGANGNWFIGDTDTGVSASGNGGGSGGVSSWNDLTDKPFGENEDGSVKQLDNKYLSILDHQAREENVLYPLTTGSTYYDRQFSVYAMPTKFADAETYSNWHSMREGDIFVELDGVTYKCTPQRLAALDNGVVIGNCLAFGGTGNNEPFIVTMLAVVDNGTTVYGWAFGVLTDTASTEHTVRVYQETPEKWLLKEECLPAGPISVDMSGLDTNGTIVETYADGTVKTTTMEFDANGNPVKIIDGDGNVTTLTW